jgi:hypothetical protein
MNKEEVVITANRLVPRVSSWVSRPILFCQISFIGALFCAACIGCGKANPYLPVSGTVKFDDGTVPQGEISSITFQPKANGPGFKGAQSTIEPDGSFQLGSERPGDGAKPGEYYVTIHVNLGYPDNKSVVPLKYANPQSSTLTAEITPDGENHFEFVIEKK